VAISRILLLDIETKPALIYSFGIRDQHINHGQIKEDGGTICVGLKWAAKAKSPSSPNGSTATRRCSKAFTGPDRGDAVATYNGASFDIPKLMGNFLVAGMIPPSTDADRHLQGRPQARLHLQQAGLYRAAVRAWREAEARRSANVDRRDGGE
jgi:hypothetical protein